MYLSLKGKAEIYPFYVYILIVKLKSLVIGDKPIAIKQIPDNIAKPIYTLLNLGIKPKTSWSVVTLVTIRPTRLLNITIEVRISI